MHVFSREWAKTHSFYLEIMVAVVDTGSLIRCLWEDLEAPIQALGYELVEVEHTGLGGQRVLRLYIDKVGGRIGLDDCSAVTRAINPLLDEKDYVHERYLLEVSSPGIDRPLRKESHFLRHKGEAVVVQTNAPIQGRKKFSGILEDIQDGMLSVTCGGVRYDIHLENLKKANLDK